jgi:L-ascorbate metabolism protein UlaG (beta-lactamase superfamily)
VPEIRITHIGGPTTLLEIGELRLLTDPTFDPPGRRYTFGWGSASHKTTGPAIPAADLLPIDAVLLSHDHHGDNLDDAGRALLPSAGVVVTTTAAASRLGGNAVGLTPWQTTTIGNGSGARPVVAVTATPARHGPPLSRPIAGRVVGFALGWEGQEHGMLWISGDTVLYDGIRQVAKRLTVDTAVLHLGGVRFGITGPVRYTMTAGEAVDLCSCCGHAPFCPSTTKVGTTSARGAKPSRPRSRPHPTRSTRACAGSPLVVLSGSDRPCQPAN